MARLLEGGFEAGKISVASQARRTNGEVVGCYNVSGRTEGQGDVGTFWAALWGVLSGWGFFMMPDTGPVLVAGPLVGWIVAALENAAIFDGLSAIGAALYSMGISRESVSEFEAAFRACKFLVIVHGTSREVDEARSVLVMRRGAGTTQSLRGEK